MRKVLAAIATLSLFVSPLFATQSRLNGLGIDNWMIQEDDSLIWLNPSRIGSYPKTLWGELGAAAGSGLAPTVNGNLAIANQWGGISGNCPLVKGAVGGLFLKRPYAGFLGLAGTNAVGSDVLAIPVDPTFGNAMTGLTPETLFDFFYSLPLGKARLGARLSLAADSASNDTSVATQPAAVIGDATAEGSLASNDLNLVVGSQFNNVGFMSTLDLVLSLGFPSAKNSHKTTVYDGTRVVTVDDWAFKTKGSMNLGFTARAAIPVKKQPLLAYVNYNSNDVSNEFTQLEDNDADGDLTSIGDINRVSERTQKQSGFTLGASYNLKTSAKTIVIVAGNISNTVETDNALRKQLDPAVAGKDQEYKSERTTLAVPVNMAIEHRVTNALAARFGIEQSIYQKTTTKTNDPDFGAFAGGTYPLATITETKSASQTLGNTTVSLGAGVNVYKGLTLDAVVRQQVLFSGTYLVSGVPETLFAQLTALYRF